MSVVEHMGRAVPRSRRVHRRSQTESRVVRVKLPAAVWRVLEGEVDQVGGTVSGVVSFYVAEVLRDLEVDREDAGDVVSSD